MGGRREKATNLRPSSGGGPGNRLPSALPPAHHHQGRTLGGHSLRCLLRCRRLPSRVYFRVFHLPGPWLCPGAPTGLLGVTANPFIWGCLRALRGEGAEIRKGSLSKWGEGSPPNGPSRDPRTQPWQGGAHVPDEGVPCMFIFRLSHMRGAAVCPPKPPESHSHRERQPPPPLGTPETRAGMPSTGT